MSFSIPIAELAQKMGADLDTVARKATFDLFRAVVLRSPVDTGRFRANWNVSFGEPNYTTSASTSESRGTGEAQKALTLPVGGVLYLANGLPYGGRLETGWSKKAPAGMVRVSVVEFEDHVRRAIGETA